MEGDEPVKIQVYDAVPDKRPAAGKFSTYKGEELTVIVPCNNFYVIHLDLQHCG
ncbi:MAG: hypothetical protein PHX56_07500 [Atribacterota bacterium]|jgi:hypothetical protein|nr:hypothetical protein [Atribacterota bacterium]MDD3640587.1 hypothetical protein [Atribacterota bacterium]